jgi:NAD(P)-dependent dehydrogenase (short-subunit alcohol dehydrogenase family)
MSIKTTVITGPTSGIGKETALALAKKDHALYLLVRNTEKGEALRQELMTQTGNQAIYVIRCDLADLQSVRDAAEELKKKLFNINILINNAGGAFPERTFSKDGFELTFAINHLGHFLLTQSLMPLLQKGHARIINVSSEAHRSAKPDFDDLLMEKSYTGFKAYGITKLFNIYFTRSLAEKYQQTGVTSFALHPGVVNTDIWDSATGFLKLLTWLMKPFMISSKQGAETTIYLATEPKLDGKNGLYFKKCKVAKTASNAENAAARNRLWEISGKLTAVENKLDV